MKSKVKVTGDELGNVITQSVNNPEYGYVRVEQIKTTIDDNNFLRRKSVSALIQGNLVDLQAEGYFAGQELPGKIVVVESINPFNSKNPARDIKHAGNTGIICTIEGLPIYRKTVYSLSTNAEDIFIKHDNVEQIKAAFNTESKQSALSPDASEFNI